LDFFDEKEYSTHIIYAKEMIAQLFILHRFMNQVQRNAFFLPPKYRYNPDEIV
jgi:hypothetical protein